VCASNLSELQRALQRSTGDAHHRGRCSRSRRQVHCTSGDRISVGEGGDERGLKKYVIVIIVIILNIVIIVIAIVIIIAIIVLLLLLLQSLWESLA